MDTVRSIIRQIETFLRQAEEYQKRHVGARVYVEFDPGASGIVYRSEILSGKVDCPDDTFSMWWTNQKTRIFMAWTRRYYWEGPEVELPLTNGNGTNVTGGLTVYNHDDGDAGHDNYVQIAGTDVGGVIPAPAKIRILNTYNSSARSGQFVIAHNAFSAPASFAHILEAENRNYVAGGTAPTADTSSSGGYIQNISWAGDAEVLLISWQLSTAFLSDAAGNNFKILARFATSPGTGYYTTVRVKGPSGYWISTLGEGPEVALGQMLIQDLGVVRLPPWLIQETNLEPVDLCIYGRRTGGGILYLDFVQVTPLDGYRLLKPRGYNTVYNTANVDDGINGVVWNEDSAGANRSGQYIGVGQQIQLWPGRTQRLYFLVTNDAGGAEILRTHSIRMWYRPRRLTL